MMRRAAKFSRDFLPVLAVFFLIMGGLQWLMGNSGNPPTAKTGSPGDGGATCASCHSGGSFGASLSLSGLPSSYDPGTSYSLTLALGGTSPKGGFEITAERNSDNAKCNTVGCSWIANQGGGGSVDLDGTNRWLGHNPAGTAKTWTFTWTAPAAGNGSITLYAAGNAANGTGSTDGDQIVTNSWPTTENKNPSISSLTPNFGSVNTRVVIAGSRFGTVISTVTFAGGVIASSTSPWTNAQITAFVPAGATTGNMTVTNATATSNGLPFTVIAGSPTISLASPGVVSGTETAKTLSLTGLSFSPGAIVKLSTTTLGLPVSSAAATGITISTSTSVSATFNLTGMATGYWTITVTNPDNQSGSLVNGFLIQTSPAQPTGLSATALSSTSIRWDWTDVASNEDGYKLLSDTGGVVSPNLGANTASFTENSLTPNTTYFRAVQAFNAIGVSTSSAAGISTLASPPSNAQVTGRTSSSVNLSWSANNNPSGTRYEVSLSTDNFALNVSTPVPISSALTNSSTTISSLSIATTYYFRVRAYNHQAIPTSFSDVASTTTLNYPNPPSQFAGLTLSTHSIQWSWRDNSSDELGFRVFSSTGGQVSPDLSANTTFWIQVGLAPGTSYQTYAVSFGPGGIQSPASNSATVFTAAGSVGIVSTSSSTLTIGGTSLSIPIGALGGDGSISASDDPANKPLLASTANDITNANAALSGLKQVPGSTRQFIALVGGARKTDNFTLPVTVTIPYTDANGDEIVDGTEVRADNLFIYSLEEGSSAWSRVSGSTVNKSAKTVSASVAHFTIFSLIGTLAATDLSRPEVFPNPFLPSQGHTKVTLKNLPANTDVRIFTFTGELVTQMSSDSAGQVTWDGKNSSGRGVASGVYFLLVQGAGQKKVLKIGVER